MKIRQILLIVGSILVLNGCFDDNTPPVYEDVEGVVTSQGEPLGDIAVHIRNHFAPGGFIESDGNSNLRVSLTIQTRDLITGKLYKNGETDPFATFIEDSLNSGNHEVSIPDSLLMNGILAYEIRNSSRQIASSLFVVNKPDTTLPKMMPFTKTSSTGEFYFDIDALSIGQAFTAPNGGGFEVTDSLQMIITQGDEVVGKGKVKVVPDQSNYFEITIE